jgi:hypothetical protein
MTFIEVQLKRHKIYFCIVVVDGICQGCPDRGRVTPPILRNFVFFARQFEKFHQ